MAKTIMIQGTMSNVGKSLLTAGLCRIFKEDGYKVAPFKAQNMALNSYITKEGLEMGRAQVVQAEAAGISPQVAMNPILLKPTSDSGSQVIVNGEVYGHFTAAEYYKVKDRLKPEVKKAFDSLAAEFDVIVIEGAGSPAEINLNEKDLVNMGMAKMANAPVLLVGDIDRGGVFATLHGTLLLLTPDERKYVKGTIINKFRGDLDILKPGLTMIEDLTKVPVLGVVPYLKVDIEDEDSLSHRLATNMKPSLIDIAVIRLPRLSNFTDFNVFELMEGVSLRYVDSVSDLNNPDLIILPGTKNTMGDLIHIRQNGLEAEILKRDAAGTPIIGICGGYQMLGMTLEDPHGVEHGGTISGMGLLETKTVFEREKVRTQTTGNFNEVGGIFQGLSGHAFEGYEIHMGVTANPEGRWLSTINTVQGNRVSHQDGAYKDHVYGSYIHGLFDRSGIAQTIVAALLEKKGLSMDSIVDINYDEYKELQYQKLATEIRKSIDMQEVYRILEEGMEKHD